MKFVYCFHTLLLVKKLETILNKYKQWHWFFYILFLFDFINKNSMFLISMFCVLLWYRNWYREPWIFTGIGTEYWNFGTVTTLGLYCTMVEMCQLLESCYNRLHCTTSTYYLHMTAMEKHGLMWEYRAGRVPTSQSMGELVIKGCNMKLSLVVMAMANLLQ